jgi:hypothetical protein
LPPVSLMLRCALASQEAHSDLLDICRQIPGPTVR